MESFYDYKKHFILYVDDEENSLKYFQQLFGNQFSILTAPSAEEGYYLLKKNPGQVAVIITDQRMPGEKGVQFLERARQLSPRTLRILVTAYSDLTAAVDAINTGAIYKYIAKPWEIPQLEVTLKRAIEFYIVQNERDQLLREKMSTLYNVMLTDRILSLGILAAGLGHHLRNAMTAVKTFLDLTPRKLAEENLDLESLRDPDFWKNYYRKVQAQMDRVTGLLSDLWETSEPPTTRFPDKARLHPMIEEAVARAGAELEKKKMKVENLVPDSLPELRVDSKKFNRLFDLLLLEEAANIPEGGKVKFTAKVLGPRDGPSEIEVQMQDSGPGLSQDALHSIFNPFFVRSGNPQEFGVYLLTCFFIIYHHGGRIAAGNKNGGNLFTFTLPVNPQVKPVSTEEKDFISKILINESMWEKLLSGG